MKTVLQTNNKVILRSRYLVLRHGLSQQRRHSASCKLLSLVDSSIKCGQHVLSFASFRDEIDTCSLNDFLAARNALCLPKIVDAKLKIYFVKDPRSQMLPNRWGLLEPDPEQCLEAPLSEIEWALVPGLAFDQRKHRIGYGKGFYDRLLPELPNAVAAGVGFCEQLSSLDLPTHDADVPLNQLWLV